MCMPACTARNKSYDAVSARAFFANHRGDLRNVVVEVSKCHGPGLVSIYPDGRVKNDSSPGVMCPGTATIAKQIRGMGVLWINISGDLPYGLHGPMSVVFILSSEGLGVSGSGSAIYYFPRMKVNPFGDSVALDGSPGNWFFRYLGSARQ